MTGRLTGKRKRKRGRQKPRERGCHLRGGEAADGVPALKRPGCNGKDKPSGLIPLTANAFSPQGFSTF
ncbi:MAG: hypothetical protein COZ06_13005 [Armatimonadetes bacterium CG_4_10_14_3_um_filter_66_18]|nr:MAG: hypothetical protein AUJ96_28680 [Armatimonadetes bacterium CG2_30_66_41]PIX47224.1 MAG: hypothetical protein COZ57_09145 [Armatimonadetes bacterium CG_4_8_14_3_um_filter_66_20]PIY49741.1 MAG: hypothetical protein COZ06_13005 [Armatimonadetes bacterium CG_4_10_14_3_um_filter_66_18]PJB60890.1 MAG: hypothetical protein CO096_31640 [Armatimonadetes bacterium CG_4_9_14_3_um_filter_66_14]